MTIQAGERVIVQDYPAEMAGQLVGYIGGEMCDSATGQSTYVSHISVATISQVGAKYTYESYYDTDRQKAGKLVWDGSVSGFENVTELTAYVERGSVPAIKSWPPSDRPRQIGDSLRPEQQPAKDTGVWAIGAEAILVALKDDLALHDCSWLYPTLYYAFNALADETQLLADPEMADQTAIELAANDSARVQLVTSLAADRQLAIDLSNSSVNNLQLTAEDFIQVRRDMAERERVLHLAHAISALNYCRYFELVGAHRTEPYMDAAQADESRAFGRELDSLQNHNFGQVIYQVTKETKELTERHRQALTIVRRLNVLQQAEDADF